MITSSTSKVSKDSKELYCFFFFFGLGGVTRDADGSAGEAGLETTCKGGRRSTDDLVGHVHDVLCVFQKEAV